jgi:pyrroloquinoline quinone biosynthesis protein B
LETSQVIVKVVGTAQDSGIPHVHCRCQYCSLARERREYQRYAASLAILLPEQQRWHLIDATPDFCEQLEWVKTDYPGMGLMSSVLLTHAHIGHYTGLMYLGREAISTRELPVYAGPQMAGTLRSHVPWKQLVELQNITIHPISARQPFVLDQNVTVTPLEVPHRNEYSETFCFILEGPHKKLLYIPDIDRWEQWEIDLAEIASTVDYCLLDGTFYSEAELEARGRSYSEVPHPLLTQTMNLLQEVVNRGETSVYFTHFNHTNPVIDRHNPFRKAVLDSGFLLADEGIEFVL